jgi:hypothetical protein
LWGIWLRIRVELGMQKWYTDDKHASGSQGWAGFPWS